MPLWFSLLSLPTTLCVWETLAHSIKPILDILFPKRGCNSIFYAPTTLCSSSITFLCIRQLSIGGKGDDRGWDGWMASLTRWTWVWVNPRSWWWTGRTGVLWFMGSQRVRHDWATSLWLFTFMHWRRKWQPTPVFLPGESHGQRSLVGCCLWVCTESDRTEAT